MSERRRGRSHEGPGMRSFSFPAAALQLVRARFFAFSFIALMP
jgi:hypothetical protein